MNFKIYELVVNDFFGDGSFMITVGAEHDGVAEIEDHCWLLTAGTIAITVPWIAAADLLVEFRICGIRCTH